MLVFWKRKIDKSSIIVTEEKKAVMNITIAVMMAKRIHLYPFRTQKLSSFTPKVLAENCREDRYSPLLLPLSSVGRATDC